MDYIITFSNTNAAIKAERYLMAEHLQVRVMPLPSQIKAGCGICLRLPEKEIGCALKILSEHQIGGTGLYTRKDNELIYSSADNPGV